MRGVDLSELSSYEDEMNTQKTLSWICSDVLREALLCDEEVRIEESTRYEQFCEFEENRSLNKPSLRVVK